MSKIEISVKNLVFSITVLSLIVAIYVGLTVWVCFPRTEIQTKTVYLYPEIRESSFHMVFEGEITIPLTSWGQPIPMGNCSITANRVELEVNLSTIVPPNSGPNYTMNETNTYVNSIHFIFDGSVTVKYFTLSVRVDHLELTIKTWMMLEEFFKNTKILSVQ